MFLRQTRYGIWSVVSIQNGKRTELSTGTKDREQAELVLERITVGDTIAGHSTVAVTERYMHLKGETMHHATDLLTRTGRR